MILKIVDLKTGTSHESLQPMREENMAKAISERQLRAATLELLVKHPKGFMTTSDLIAELEHIFMPEGLDAAILANRSDTHFSQKVRNIISHRGSSTSLMKKGFVIYHKDREGLEITEAGRAFLKTIKH